MEAPIGRSAEEVLADYQAAIAASDAALPVLGRLRARRRGRRARRRADAVGGSALREHGAPYGSDLRLYAAAGIPTSQFGPGDVRLAHSPQEQVSISEIAGVARTVVLSVLRMVGTR